MTPSSAQLEQEAEQARAEIAGTLDELRGVLSPGQVFDQVVDYARDSGAGEMMRNLGHDLRANPLPLALVGAGVAWLMMGKAPRRTVPADSAGDRAGSAATAAAEMASSAYAGAAEGLRSAGEQVRVTAEAGRGLVDLVKDQPLVLAGLGLALGAALGASLPATETEDRLIGEAEARGGDDGAGLDAGPTAGAGGGNRATLAGAEERPVRPGHQAAAGSEVGPP
jgi:hypothetical protein